MAGCRRQQSDHLRWLCRAAAQTGAIDDFSGECYTAGEQRFPGVENRREALSRAIVQSCPERMAAACVGPAAGRNGECRAKRHGSLRKCTGNGFGMHDGGKTFGSDMTGRKTEERR